MQSLIEETIRLIGWGALKLVTLGRYKGGQASDVVAEGGLGFAIVVGAAIVIAATV